MSAEEQQQYLTTNDLAERWKVPPYSVTKAVYLSQKRALGDSRRAPKEDKRVGRTRMWNVEKLSSLDTWWSTLNPIVTLTNLPAFIEKENQEDHNMTDIHKGDPASQETTDPMEYLTETVKITFTPAKEFPHLNLTHILAIVQREEGPVEKYFIPLREWDHIRKHFS